VFREAAKFYYILLSKTFCYSSTFIMENMKAWMKANCHPDHFRGVFQEAVANNQMKTAIYGSLLAVVIVWALVTKWTRSRKSPASRPSTPDIEKPKVSLLEGRGARVDRKWGGILDTLWIYHFADNWDKNGLLLTSSVPLHLRILTGTFTPPNLYPIGLLDMDRMFTITSNMYRRLIGLPENTTLQWA
jgi:hypothetical protein